MRIWRTAFAACALLLSTPAQTPPLPNGAETHWEIDGVNEIAVQMLFDPAMVADRLPPGLRFQTAAGDSAESLPSAGISCRSPRTGGIRHFSPPIRSL
jgi:hypothetical protein